MNRIQLARDRIQHGNARRGIFELSEQPLASQWEANQSPRSSPYLHRHHSLHFDPEFRKVDSCHRTVNWTVVTGLSTEQQADSLKQRSVSIRKVSSQLHLDLGRTDE